MFLLIPYAIGRQTKRIPMVTYGLIFFNVFIYLISVLGNFQNTIGILGFKPDHNAWYTWLTASFIHANLFHLAGNMVFLYTFGTFLEDILGELKFLFVYVLGALASASVFAIVNLLFIPQAAMIPLIGASGAIAALLGLAMIRFRGDSLHVFYIVWLLLIKWGSFTVKTYMAILAYLSVELLSGLFQILTGAVGGVGHWAHIGGLAFGIASVRLLNLKREVVAEEKEGKADSWFRVGNMDAAASRFEELIEENPDQARYYHMAGKAYCEKDNIGEAEKNFSRAIELYLRDHTKAAAVEAYKDLIECATDAKLAPATQFAVSSACEALSSFEMAIYGFKRFIDVYPEDGRAELCLTRIGQIYEKMGDDQAAAVVYADFLSLYPASEWCSWVSGRLEEREPAQPKDELSSQNGNDLDFEFENFPRQRMI